MNTGEVLKQARKKLNLTQKQVAELVDVSQNNISAIEGNSRKLGLKLATKFAKVYNLSLEAIVYPQGIDSTPEAQEVTAKMEQLKGANQPKVA